MPSDILREQEQPDTGGIPAPPPLPKISLADQFTQGMAQLRARREATEKAQLEQAETEKAAMAPAREGMREAVSQPLPPVPETPQLPKSPTIAARPFMEGMPGEPPVQVLNRTLMGLGLMAQMAVGISRNNAQGALAAYTGALRGWQQGDRERGENEWKTYLGQVDNLQRDFNNRQRQYHTIWEKYQFDIERRKIEMLLTASEQQEDRRALQLVAQNNDKFMEELKVTGTMLERMHKDAQDLNFKIWSKQQDDETKKWQAQYHRDTMMMMQQAKEKASGGSVDPKTGGLTPEALDNEAANYMMNRQLPPMGRGKAADDRRIAIINRATALQLERGMDPANAQERKMLSDANAAELKKLQTQRAIVLPFARTAEANLNLAKELSEKVDRTGQPAFNRWLLAGRNKIEGDTNVTNLNGAVRVAINEVAKVTSGSSQGSDTSRKEVEATLNSAMTKEQFKSAIENVLEKDVKNRELGYQQQIDAIMRSQRALSGRGETPKPAGAADYIFKDGKLVPNAH